jgi:alkylation response protein AidB-like acyl-CoA dehydrogenase
MPFDEPGGGYKTSAVERDGGWVINGMKHFVSNGSRAGLYLLFAQTVKGRSVVDGSTCFLIEDGTDGFTYGTVHDKLGERLANNSELIFQDCFVPAENVIGEPHRGYDVQATFFPSSNAYAAATVLGTATGAYERALAWTQQRVQGGKPLIEHDTVAVTLAEMRMLLDVARTYVHHAAEASDHRDEGWDPMLSAYPKLFTSQIAWQVTTKAMELHGGYGYMKNLGMEKILRDTAAFLHSDGANLTLMLKAANVIRAEVA